MKYSYLAVEGNIGAGKTELSQIIAEKYQANLILEEFASNSYLEKFYENMERYAFPLEVSFLVERYQQMNVEFQKKGLFNENFVSDYLFDKSIIFARNNLDDGHYHLFKSLFEIFNNQVTQPDLILYLHKPVFELQQNIMKRGRSFEQNIDAKYLENIQHAYFGYLKTLRNQRIIIADTAGSDFINDEKTLNKLLNLLEEDHPGKMNIVDI